MILLSEPRDLFYTVFGLFAAGTCIIWIAFGRLTMARIEREIRSAGLTRPAPWDGPGLRILWYAYAICLPIGPWNRKEDPMIDVPLVRHYAIPADRIRGWLLIILGNCLLVIGLLGAIVFDYYQVQTGYRSRRYRMDLLGGTTIMEAVFTFMFLAVMMIAFNSWTVFARLATARIEREIRVSGLPRPAPWDGVGYVRPVQREPDQRA